jgi:nucleotide-binding universal stress UspA family protein
LGQLAETQRAAGTPVSWTVRQGDPPTLIKEEAEKHPDTLIAMCTHGRSGHSRWWLGSTTDKVSHATTNPLLVIRSSEPEAADQASTATLVPPEIKPAGCSVLLDGSPLAEGVLPHVATLAQALSLPVELVRVIPEVESHFWELFPDEPDRDREGPARVYLEGLAQTLKEQGVSDVKITLLNGHPASTLGDFARSNPRNLIALMTHGLGSSGIYRWTMGSVAQRVVGNALGPVLMIRAPDHLPD